MVLEFTGGDLNLIVQLEAFNNAKGEWNNEMAKKQQEIDAFMNAVLHCYFDGKIS